MITLLTCVLPVIAAVILLYALYSKGDVKAAVKFPFCAFCFEAKDRKNGATSSTAVLRVFPRDSSSAKR